MSEKMFNAAVGISRECIATEMQRPIDIGIVWAADRISTLEEAQRWIPVSERLPENYQRVIACGTDYANEPVGAAKFIDGKWYDQDVVDNCGDWERLYNVTHWLPLPAPPEAI